MRVLVIGTGFGAGVMAPAFEREGFAVRVISPRDGKALRLALDESPDLVSIHSPPFMHREHVDLALDRGLAVLCDKPFGLDAADAAAMRDRAQALGAANFVNFELRWKPARIKLKQLLQGGAIGTLQHVSWTMFGDGLRQQKYGWLHDAALGGGWIGAYGAHGIDMLRWLTGSEIAECGGVVRADVAQRPDSSGVLRPVSAEDAFSAWFALDNGCTASFDTGFSTASSFPERILFLGSEGAIELIGDITLELRQAGLPPERIDFADAAESGYAPALRRWLPAVVQAMAERRPLAPDFSDGAAVTDVLDRLRASAFKSGALR